MGRGRDVEIPFLSKAPFANYDLVVYLGGGLFSLLVFWRYVGRPFRIFDFSSLVADSSNGWTQDVIYLALLLVFAYVLGHLISYQSSYFIEGLVERSLGRFSRVVEITTVNPTARADALRAEIRKNICRNAFRYWNVPGFFRYIPFPRLVTLVHFPLLPWYALVYALGLFEFANTRIPARMLEGARATLKERFPETTFDDGRQWFRWMEYFTNYNRPIAAASMYNYLVISGLMRSLSYALLIAIWFEWGYLICSLVTDTERVTHGEGGWTGLTLYFLAVYAAYITTLTSYCKFFRRYVEEAIMGFFLEGRETPAVQDPPAPALT